jgi:FlaA1/EpsC-like NDP-sugar epimerase
MSMFPGSWTPMGSEDDRLFEALLGRKPARWDQRLLGERIRGRVVLISGAAGSLGSELCRHIAEFEPLALVGFDQAETALFLLEGELKGKFPRLGFHAEIGDVTRADDVNLLMRRYGPAFVYHAAGYKHVPMMERQASCAVRNNVFGTWELANAAAAHGVDRFVLISSDKAVEPASVMGATKRLAEMAIAALGEGSGNHSGTKFVAVRFGNVLGSSGSVVPIFRAQIAMGGPVTVTHPGMKRYFMAPSEAAQLVIEASMLGDGGETFVLDMGEPVGIYELARAMIRLAGFEPDREIRIEMTGIRAGEKLVEALLGPGDDLAPTAHPRVRRVVTREAATSGRAQEAGFQGRIDALSQAVGEHDDLAVAAVLKRLLVDPVPAS